MKKILSKLIAILFITTLFSSCAVDMFNKISGNKNVISKNRTSKENFTKIKVSTGLDLYVSMGAKNKVTLEADENLHEIIITEVVNGTLKIYSEKSIWRAKSKKVYVTITSLEALTATSGANIYTNESLKVNDIKLSSTSGANINVSLNANSIETTATSGSDIEVSGVSNNHISKATSGASIDAYQLRSKSVNVKATSGADINIYASKSINAVATSGGDIDFKGRPTEIDKRSSSGGSISAK